MADIITTAGLETAFCPPPFDKRKEALHEIRSKMRKVDATDDEWDDALDALLELAKD